ncbi:MAG: pseudouridine synthase [Nannocystaceae bacterium]|nr:pseudouridine synthase [Nannocystaceae bacterium]
MLIALHKPYGVISQFLPKGGHPTLAGLGLPARVHPAGRLDADSEGLLLLTDDGALQHRLTDPRFDHPKTYWAQVEGAPDDAALQPLREGIVLRDGPTRPAQARVLSPPPAIAPREPPIRVRKSVPDTWIELVLVEGRNRQVRRMTAAVGFPTLRLLRVAVGSIGLGELQPGQWREVPAPPPNRR